MSVSFSEYQAIAHKDEQEIAHLGNKKVCDKKQRIWSIVSDRVIERKNK